MRSNKSLLWTAILAACLIPGGFAFASDFSVHGDSIEFTTGGEAGTLTISGPADFRVRQDFAAGEVTSLGLFNKKGGNLADGTYTWELTLSGEASGERGTSGVSSRTGEVRSGVFTIADGSIVNPKAIESLPNKDQQILDDLIVGGSICAGQDCNNGESFGFDTIRLKENNLRIRAFDTSNSASFPTVDWQLTFNDSSNGGANKFSIDSIDNAATPFTVEFGAPSHSLYVDDGGRIGLGKNTPVVELHIADGNTPTVRLEQDGSDGFTAQTWDLAGNETNFFIRDATNGSALAFRIFPGSGTANALNIASNGNVGVGTTTPDSNLDIEDALPELRLTSTDGGSSVWEMRINNAGRLQLQNQISSFTPFVIDDAAVNNLLRVGVDNSTTVDINGDLVINGACSDTDGGDGTSGDDCDGVFQPGYPLLSLEDHAAFMWENSYLPGVGPTPAGARWNLNKKAAGILNELEKAHIYIERLHKRLEAKDAVLTDIQARLQALEGNEN